MKWIIGADASAIMIMLELDPKAKEYRSAINRLTYNSKMVWGQPALGEIHTIFQEMSILDQHTFVDKQNDILRRYKFSADPFRPITNKGIRAAHWLSQHDERIRNMDAIITGHYLADSDIDAILTTDQAILGLSKSQFLKEMFAEHMIERIPKIYGFNGGV